MCSSDLFGDQKLEMGYLIEAHTDGDVYVRFPGANVIVAGDAISPQVDPVLDWFGGGWLGGRVDAQKKLLELGDARTRYVPAFGPVVGRAEVQAEHDLMTTIFDRSWYNRAGVERVMNFCTDAELQEFFRTVPEYEKMLVRSGITLVKYWFSISDEEQYLRFESRIHDPLKQWKLSPMDLESRRRWEE